MTTTRPASGSDEGEERASADLPAQPADARQESVQVERDRRAATDRETLLRSELQHRVRNMLAIIRSIFSRTVAAGGSLDEVADHFQGRLDALARYQNFQLLEPGGAIDLELVVRDELNSFQFGDHPGIGISGPEVRMPPDMAQMTGLAIHELVTNSIKFGVLASLGDGGRLEVSWKLTGAHLRFSWLETGVSVISSAPLRRGFGREFIEQALPYQIGGETRFELRPGGIYCEIVAPLNPVPPHVNRIAAL